MVCYREINKVVAISYTLLYYQRYIHPNKDRIIIFVSGVNNKNFYKILKNYTVCGKNLDKQF